MFIASSPNSTNLHLQRQCTLICFFVHVPVLASWLIFICSSLARCDETSGVIKMAKPGQQIFIKTATLVTQELTDDTQVMQSNRAKCNTSHIFDTNIISSPTSPSNKKVAAPVFHLIYSYLCVMWSTLGLPTIKRAIQINLTRHAILDCI